MVDKVGTRCTVCVGCGKCFSDEPSEGAWSGERCDVCVGCGKCAREWGLLGSDGADGVSGPTNWADAFKAMDTGNTEAPPAVPAAPGAVVASEEDSGQNSPDATTGATPGVASACKELGLDDMANVTNRLGIKPPGVS